MHRYVAGVAFFLIFIGRLVSVADPPKARPTLSLEKSKYTLGESIRFWIGVVAEGQDTIPRDKRETCFLHIKSPDGSLKKQHVSWPQDGAADPAFWSGGRGISSDEVMEGTYELVFEYAGRRTDPVELVVERLPVLDQISAEFRFGRSGSVTPKTHIPITLEVHNGSSHTIRFPQRGVFGHGSVSFRVERQEPPRGSSQFFPNEKLPGPDPKVHRDRYDWSALSITPTVTLPPGEEYRLELALEDAYTFWGPGTYDVEFSTALELLIGEEDGEFAPYCPIRLVVQASEEFVVEDADE